MKKVRLLLAVSFAAFIVLGMMSSASAIIITPTTVPQWQGYDPKNPHANDIPGLVGYEGTLYELYKQEVGETSVPGEESGMYASSYQTTFFNTEYDPHDALIQWVDGTEYISGDPLYLLVKDGDHDPIWYIFDLSELGWDGMEDIFLDNFWPVEGAISHVAIYGGTPVPEPATMFLLGFGLISLAGIRRKFKKKV